MASSPSGQGVSKASKPRFGLLSKVKEKVSSRSQAKVVIPTPLETVVAIEPQPISQVQKIASNTRSSSQNPTSFISELSIRVDNAVIDAAQTVSETTSANIEVPNITKEVLEPIRDVWSEAYGDLGAENGDLITKYEGRLRQSLDTALVSSIVNVNRGDLMKAVVAKKLEEYKENAWKVNLLGEQFLIKDGAKPLVGIIKWADKYVGDALKSNPMASLGWAGVMVFLPLLLNPSEQEKALLEGLATISDILVRSAMQENLYFQRWEANPDKNDRANFIQLHKGYRDTLKALYVHVLKFQATSVCYFSQNGGLQVLEDMVRWHAWEDILNDVKKQDEATCHAYNLLGDARIEEEFEKSEKRHAATVGILTSGFKDIKALRTAIENEQLNSQRKELLDWLSSIDPSLNYNNARGRFENGGQGTGEWLIQNNKDFDRWKISSNSLMWLNGKAGSGKSVLSSSVINHLHKAHEGDPQVALAYFYFSFNDEQKQTTVGMMESIIKQICCCRPNTPLSIKALEELKAKGHRPDLSTLQRVLVETLRGFSSVYVMIDALDECPDLQQSREVLLGCLTTIHQMTLSNLHMLLTSRREKDIEISYQVIKSKSEKWDINLSEYKPAIAYDIGLFIDSTLSSQSYGSWPEELKKEAREELIKKSDGMFQYVSCQFEALRSLKDKRKIKKALKELPKGLDATYDRMLRQASPDYQKQVARVLEWLSFSLRPLLLEEVAEICILDREAEVPIDEANRFNSPRDVLEVLSGLVTEVPRHIGKYDGDHYTKRETDRIEIRLAHFSIKEYLASDRMSPNLSATFGIDEIHAHIHITESCLAYHLHLSETRLATEELARQYQLWEYVVEYWPRHLHLIPSDKCTATITQGALQIFTRGSQSLVNMARFRAPPDWRIIAPWSHTANELATPLYYACSIGALKLAEMIVEADRSADIDEISSESEFGTLLAAASAHGHERIVQSIKRYHMYILELNRYIT